MNPYFQQIPNQQFNTPFNNQQSPNQQFNVPKNTNVDWIDINDIKNINNITIQPNTVAWIKSINEPIIAKKSSDSMGICTTEFF